MFSYQHCGADRRTVAPIPACARGAKVDVERRATAAQPLARPPRPTAPVDIADVELAAPASRRRLLFAGAFAAFAMGRAPGHRAARRQPFPLDTPSCRSHRGSRGTAAPAAADHKRIVIRVERIQVAPDGREWDGPIWVVINDGKYRQPGQRPHPLLHPSPQDRRVGKRRSCWGARRAATALPRSPNSTRSLSC